MHTEDLSSRDSGQAMRFHDQMEVAVIQTHSVVIVHYLMHFPRPSRILVEHDGKLNAALHTRVSASLRKTWQAITV